jgi:hypothetical protein
MRRLATFSALSLGLLASSTISAATFSQTPTADAFSSSTNSGSNYGGAGALAIAAAGLPKGEFQSLLQFNLSNAQASFDAVYGAGQWTLSAASLQLSAVSPNNTIFNAPASGQIAVTWQFFDSWVEGSGMPSAPSDTGVNWNSILLTTFDQNLGAISYDGGFPEVVTIPLAVTSGIASDALAGSLLSLRLYAPPGETATSGVFNSRSVSGASNRPTLTLTAVAVPEPSSVFGILFVCAAAAPSCRRSP